MKKAMIIIVILAILGIAFVLSKKSAAVPVQQNNMPQTQVQMSGIHIMEDGSIMSPQGGPVSGATIMSDGNIKLDDGRIVQPMADYRKK